MVPFRFSDQLRPVNASQRFYPVKYITRSPAKERRRSLVSILVHENGIHLHSKKGASTTVLKNKALWGPLQVLCEVGYEPGIGSTF